MFTCNANSNRLFLLPGVYRFCFHPVSHKNFSILCFQWAVKICPKDYRYRPLVKFPFALPVPDEQITKQHSAQMGKMGYITSRGREAIV